MELICSKCKNFLVPPVFSDDKNYCHTCGDGNWGIKENTVLVDTIVKLEIKIKCHLCENFEGTFKEYMADHHPCAKERAPCKHKCSLRVAKTELAAHENKCKEREFKCQTCEKTAIRRGIISHFSLNKDHKQPKVIVRMTKGAKFELGIDILPNLLIRIHEKTEHKFPKISLMHYGKYGVKLTNADINDAIESGKDLVIYARIYPVQSRRD